MLRHKVTAGVQLRSSGASPSTTLDRSYQGARGKSRAQETIEGALISLETTKLKAVRIGKLTPASDETVGAQKHEGREFSLALNCAVGVSPTPVDRSR